jgi:hypothetical protein
VEEEGALAALVPEEAARVVASGRAAATPVEEVKPAEALRVSQEE